MDDRFHCVKTKRFTVINFVSGASTTDDPLQALNEPEEDRRTHEHLLKILRESKVDFKHTTHGAVKTSEEAAQIRGVSLASGAKAMLLLTSKGSSKAYLTVISAAKKFDWKKIKKAGIKDSRMASEGEVRQMTGCIPGAIPPFGSLFPIPVTTIMDPSIQEQGTFINFNCGLRTDSLQMSVEDYLKIEKPRIEDVAT